MFKFGQDSRFGDLIYSLYVVQEAGGGEYYVKPPRLSRQEYELMIPLVSIQPYISNFLYGDPPADTIMLQEFCNHRHLIQTFINTANNKYGLNITYTPKPWLFNIPKDKSEDYIVIQRTGRYCDGVTFNYRDHLESNVTLIFCGQESEYISFMVDYSDLNIEYVPTIDFFDFARLIYNSKYFIGNQSVGSAIAQGLFHPQIQETSARQPNCIPHVIYTLEK